MDEPETMVEGSRNGAPRVAYDRNVWIPCPPLFPPEMDIDQWAAEYGRVFSEIPGRRPNRRAASKLAALLKYIHGSLYEHMALHLAFIHMPNPHVVPVPVCIGAWQQGGERADRLRALAGADEPEATVPPIVEPFSTSNLGDGLRVLCDVKTAGAKKPTTMLSYAFRDEEHETDLRIFTGCDDPARMQRLLPDADELVRQITVVEL